MAVAWVCDACGHRNPTWRFQCRRCRTDRSSVHRYLQPRGTGAVMPKQIQKSKPAKPREPKPVDRRTPSGKQLPY